MSCVIDLSQWRNASRSLSHPAGVALPFGDSGQADFLIPEIRHAIGSGSHCADVIRALPAVVRPGERVLVLGSGLGVLSTLIAKTPGIAQVITIEPNVTLADYIDQVHKSNGVDWIEILNAVPSEGGRGRVPLFVRHDVRTSSLVPEDGPWKQVMLVPEVNLDLILAEERISLIVGAGSAAFAPWLARAQIDPVDRMLFGSEPATEREAEQDMLAEQLVQQDFAIQRFGTALLFDRAEEQGTLKKHAASSR